jgi:hypothetical protein
MGTNRDQKRDFCLTVMIDTSSTITQPRDLSSESTIRDRLRVLFTDPANTPLYVTRKIIVETQCASEGYCDVFDGWLLTREVKKAALRANLKSKEQFNKYLKQNPMVIKRVSVKRPHFFPSIDNDGAKVG